MSRDQRVSISFIQYRSHALRIEKKALRIIERRLMTVHLQRTAV
jgi:hypothetical protein